MLERNQLTARQVAEIIHEQFPGLPISSISYLGEGCDSVAFEVNSEFVFRFPKQDDVEQQLLLELRILPLLTEHSPIPLPGFCFHGRPSVGFHEGAHRANCESSRGQSRASFRSAH